METTHCTVHVLSAALPLAKQQIVQVTPLSYTSPSLVNEWRHFVNDLHVHVAADLLLGYQIIRLCMVHLIGVSLGQWTASWYSVASSPGFPLLVRKAGFLYPGDGSLGTRLGIVSDLALSGSGWSMSNWELLIW